MLGVHASSWVRLTMLRRTLSHGRVDPPLKLVLCVRTDLKMRAGKIGAQCGHASVMAYSELLTSTPEAANYWKERGQKKVVLRVESSEQMMDIYTQARAAGLQAGIVHDAGHTQVEAGSATVLAIGPANAAAIDAVTGQLKLYR